MAAASIRVRPVTPATWPDFARLFEARGSPHSCWCMVYRSPRSHEMAPAAKRAAMRKRVQSGTPVGLLAYDGEEPVGWCSVAPRETYARLARSRTMPRVDDAPTWTILCFFVRRTARRAGVTAALLEGAVAYARERGAEVVEGYPFDTAGITSRHRGHSSIFRRAGLELEGARWVLRAKSKRPARASTRRPHLL